MLLYPILVRWWFETKSDKSCSFFKGILGIGVVMTVTQFLFIYVPGNTLSANHKGKQAIVDRNFDFG